MRYFDKMLVKLTYMRLLGFAEIQCLFRGVRVGTGLVDAATNLPSSVLFSQRSMPLEKCVCQPQIVYLDSGGFPAEPQWGSVPGPHWGTSIPRLSVPTLHPNNGYATGSNITWSNSRKANRKPKICCC